MTRDDQIRAWYDAHAGFLLRVLEKLAGKGPHAEDLLQETFMIAHRRYADFARESSDRTWLYGIARRVAMRHGRSLARFLRLRERAAVEPVTPIATPEDAFAREATAAAARAILRDLPFKVREAFVLCELEELPGTRPRRCSGSRSARCGAACTRDGLSSARPGSGAKEGRRREHSAGAQTPQR